MWVAVAACAATLAACGSGGSTTVVKTVTGSQPSPATTTTTTPAEPTTQSTSQPQPTPGRSALHLAFFRSPTGNIGCVIAEGIARCDIRDRSWSPPPRPRSCNGNTGYGQGLIVGTTGRAHFVCAGDTALNPNGRAVPYGRDSRVPGFTCHSATDGITCRSTRTGRGFFLNRERYRIF
ncbi:MAG: hypothetical protein QOK04_2752 [Solirubrobacteraceae bacterium]|jgi:hypothetical protein|nr:hypothetical protein [Solirubrobacteraceae bacterium]